MDRFEVEELTAQFAPLVKASAHRYQGRGAEYEDLVQEGYLALILLIPKCEERKWLPAFLKSRVPGYVRAAAARMRRCECAELEEAEPFLRDERDRTEREAGEIRDMLSRVLSPEDLDLTQALLEGFTQKEIAEVTGVTQQAVSQRLRRIRAALRPFVCDRD
jgi:RNA polymerase sigma factor (sigma-70 family)